MIRNLLKKIYHYFRQGDRLRSLGIGLGVLAFLWFALFGDQGLYQLHKTNSLKSELGQNIVQLKNRIERLKKNKELLNDPRHLEMVIRQELGYVRPGEVVFQQMNP